MLTKHMKDPESGRKVNVDLKQYPAGSNPSAQSRVSVPLAQQLWACGLGSLTDNLGKLEQEDAPASSHSSMA